MTKHRLPVEYEDTYQMGVPAMSKKLADHTDEELLLALVTRNKMRRGPSRVSYSVIPYNVIIGIGKDHHADIMIGAEDFDQLKEVVARTDLDAGTRRKHQPDTEAPSREGEERDTTGRPDAAIRGKRDVQSTEPADTTEQEPAGQDDEVAVVPPSST